MKIVLLESLGISGELLKEYGAELEKQGHEFRAYEKDTDPQVQIERAQDADVIMLANMPLSGQVIRSCPSLKFIDVAFTGVDHVDLETAKERGIAVSNASGYSNESVAELVLGTAITLLRRIRETERRCREGGTKDGLVGGELRGRTVGIIGYGAIGSRTAELFHAFGCRILAYSRHEKENIPDYVNWVSLEDLIRQSDLISLHCPLTPETRGLMNEERISRMKKDAVLINMARGLVVDSNALARALNEGLIAGAAVDVFETEPPIAPDHPLLEAKNCLVTPHIAFASQESMKLRADIVFDSLRKWLEGGQINTILPRQEE